MGTTIKELRLLCGMTQRDFCTEFFQIPLRTLEDWEAGRRTPAPYYIRLLSHCIEERLIKNDGLSLLSENDTAAVYCQYAISPSSFPFLLMDKKGAHYAKDTDGFLHRLYPKADPMAFGDDNKNTGV